MMGTIAATLQNKVQKSLTNHKSLSVLMYVSFMIADKSNQIKSIVFLDSNENKMRSISTHTHTHNIWVVGGIKSDDE